MKPHNTMRYLLIIFSVFFCFSEISAQGEIKLNQIGFYPDSPKMAIIPGQVTGNFHLVDTATNQIVYTNQISEPQYWHYSGEHVSQADFSEFQRPGTYRVVQSVAGSSYPFQIQEEVHRELSAAAIKAFYFNRASTALEEEYAGKWARPAGHPDDHAYIHRSAATKDRPEGTVISSPGGWYDAGDYNKYAVNSGISTYTLLAAYEHFPEYFRQLNLNIPESGNDVPDILDEIRWNLEWMLTIQDPNDGGVYHKLTSLNFSGIIMPHEDQSDRYAVMKSTAGTLNFAAVMAVASRVFEPYDAEFSEICLKAAEFAWQWAADHPDVLYRQPSDVHTGAYGDSNPDDEFDWAAAELFITTGNDTYWYSRDFLNIDVGIPNWRYVRPLAWVSLFHHRNNLPAAADPSMIEERIRQQGDELLQEYSESAYGVTKGRYENDFVWGSNGVIGNHSLMLIQAYRLTNHTDYLYAALSNLDYILGRNATGYSFVTGFGSQSPMDPHHRQSAADDVDDPVPGFVVGGPQPGQQDNCEYLSDLPALSYLDDWCSYSTNEVAINWNAPLAYLAGAIEYFMNN
jgi:endoglucanase